MTEEAILHHEWITGGKITKEPPERSGDGTQRGTVLFSIGLLGSGKGGSSRSSPHAAILHRRQHPHRPADPSALQYVHSLLHPDDGSSTFDSVYHPEDDDVVHPPHATFILDAVPGQAHGSVARVVDSVSTVPMPICSKKELVSQLVGTYGLDEPTALWMTTNLVKSPCGTPDGGDGFVWTFDLNIIRQILEDFPQQDFMELTRDVGARYVNHPNGIGSAGRKSRLSVVMAGKNEAWTSSIVEKMEMTLRERSLPSHDPFLTMHTLPDAGHNVHVDDLEGLMRLLEEGFR